jgi:WD40 repeat protein
MSDNVAEWLTTTGRGDRPTLRWSFSVDAPLTDIRLSRETGEVVAADVSGGLYLLNRRGQIQALTRTRHTVKRLAWSDTGGVGAAILDDRKIGLFNRNLQFQWTRELPDEIISVAVDPYGTHVAAGQADGVNVVYTQENKKCSRFETERPVRHIQFLTNDTELVVASEYGFIGRYSISGIPVWTTKLWSTVGDLTATGDGRSIFLAGFGLGIQAFDGQTGNARGTFVCDGTVGLVSSGFTKRGIVAYTLERTLFGVDDSGTPLWNVNPDEDIQKIILSPLGDFIICGFNSGRIMRFDTMQ